MKLKTIGCVALMAVSTAALAQTTTTRTQPGMNNMAGMNSTMDPSMNGMDDMSMSNETAAPNSTMTPR